LDKVEIVYYKNAVPTTINSTFELGEPTIFTGNLQVYRNVTSSGFNNDYNSFYFNP